MPRFESKHVALIDNQPHFVGGERSTLARGHQRKRRELFDKTETKRSAIQAWSRYKQATAELRIIAPAIGRWMA